MNGILSETPEKLRLVEDFCNSATLLHDIDALRTVRDAHAWLSRNGWDSVDSAGELARLREERELIRAFLIDRSDPSARHGLNQVVQDHWAGVRVDEDGQLALIAAADVMSPASAAIEALVLHGLTAAGRRLKTCASEACRYVFYDSSRSRTRTWCDMNICGARSKMRQYRARLDSIND